MDAIKKWGQDLSKMRARAFNLYDANYSEGVKKFPEFKKEYDEQKKLSK
jgi:hypothetical protein